MVHHWSLPPMSKDDREKGFKGQEEVREWDKRGMREQWTGKAEYKEKCKKKEKEKHCEKATSCPSESILHICMVASLLEGLCVWDKTQDFQVPESIKKNYRKFSSPSLALHLTCKQAFSVKHAFIKCIHSLQWPYVLSFQGKAAGHGGVGRQSDKSTCGCGRQPEQNIRVTWGWMRCQCPGPSPFHSTLGWDLSKLQSNSNMQPELWTLRWWSTKPSTNIRSAKLPHI